MRKIILLLLMIPFSLQAGTLAPFTSDGCSLFPNGSLSDNQRWLHCCRAHDFDYWQGGMRSQRVASDKRLSQCVSEVGPVGLGILMYLGVRVGGSPLWPTSFRWGYGWQLGRGYHALSPQEQAQVAERTNQFCHKSTDILCDREIF